MELLQGIEGEREQATVLAKFDVLQALRLGITQTMMRRIARGEGTEQGKPLSFHRSIGKTIVGMRGDLRGFSYAEVETTAEEQGTFDLIYPSVLETPEASSVR